MRHAPDLETLRYTGSLYFVAGELDLASADRLGDLLDGALADHGPVTLDMSAVTFIDSTAVGAIAGAMRRAGDGCLILHGVRSSVGRALALMRVDDIPGVHVTPCERDPFPSGRALMGPEGSQDLVRQLAEMTVRFRASQAATTRLTAETGVVLERARSTRRRSVDVRATVRLAHAERVAA